MAEIREFRLPDLGEGLEEAELVEWLVGVGDEVALNQTVAEVETAKATVAVPSPFAGVVVELCGLVGGQIDVGDVLVRIEVGGSPVADTDGSAARRAGRTDGEKEASGPQQPPTLVGYGSRDAGSTRRRRRGVVAPRSAAPHGRVRAKPVVRQLAKELGVDLAAVSASGATGVVTEADVRAAATSVSGSTGAIPAPPTGPTTGDPAGPAPAGGSAGVGSAPAVDPGDSRDPGEAPSPGDVQPIRGVKRRIVEKMERSRREIPDASCSLEADVSSLLDVRARFVAEAARRRSTVRITPLHLAMRAVTLALRRHPTLNARITRPTADEVGESDAGEITLLADINLGFAMDTPRGLIVPNVAGADAMSAWELAEAVAGLSERARSGRLRPQELTGGTFTVNNYGAFGIDDGDPILNHPEAAILGIGAIRQRPWVVDGQILARSTARFTLAFDHRINDGAQAAAFLTDVVSACEDASWLLGE